MTYYGRWTYKYEIASEKGAAAAILVHETGPAGYPFEVVEGKLEPRELRHRPAERAARRPTRRRRGMDSLDEGQRAVPGLRPGFRGAQASRRQARLPPGRRWAATARFSITNALREVKSRNVVARLEGSDPRSRTRRWSTRPTGTIWAATRAL